MFAVIESFHVFVVTENDIIHRELRAVFPSFILPLDSVLPKQRAAFPSL